MPDIFKEVLFNGGEGIEPNDFNIAQRYARALLLDGVIGRLMRSSDVGTSLVTNLCWVFGNDGAPYDGAGNRESSHIGGILFQRVDGATLDGDDSKILAYCATGDEYAVVHDTATANPRWDLISVQLEQVDDDVADEESRDFEDATTRALTTATNIVKKRKVVANFTVTKGTESATPAVPATPAGHVRIAAYRISPAMTTFDPTTDVRDFRMPFGSGFDEVMAGAAVISHENDWTRHIDYVTNAIGAYITFPCPSPGGSRRLTRMQAISHYEAGTTPTVTGVRWHIGNGNPTDAVDAAVAMIVLTGLRTTADPTDHEFRSYDFLASSPDLPVWTNGYPAGYAAQRQVAEGRCDVALDVERPAVFAVVWEYQGDGTAAQQLWLRSMRFQFAGGL